jgi:hypothetical protein
MASASLAHLPGRFILQLALPPNTCVLCRRTSTGVFTNFVYHDSADYCESSMKHPYKYCGSPQRASSPPAPRAADLKRSMHIWYRYKANTLVAKGLAIVVRYRICRKYISGYRVGHCRPVSDLPYIY